MTNDFDLCSFCGKQGSDITVIIVGPDACICDQCIGVCITKIAEVSRERKRALAEAIEMIHNFEINY